MRARHVHLLILAEDIGDNAKKKLSDKCNFYEVPCVYMDGALMNMAIGDRNRKQSQFWTRDLQRRLQLA
ncbi:MAG: hypothetical protein ACLUQK_10350 [Clostridium sp.]